MSASRRILASSPSAKPVSFPAAPMTRWHGATMDTKYDDCATLERYASQCARMVQTYSWTDANCREHVSRHHNKDQIRYSGSTIALPRSAVANAISAIEKPGPLPNRNSEKLGQSVVGRSLGFTRAFSERPRRRAVCFNQSSPVAFDQNTILPLICNCRLRFAWLVPICPKLAGLLTSLPGWPKIGWFRRLNDSARN